jgi:hypothetical protein
MKGKIVVTERSKEVIYGDTYSVTWWSIAGKGMFQLWRSGIHPSVGPAGSESKRYQDWPASGVHPLSGMYGEHSL